MRLIENIARHLDLTYPLEGAFNLSDRTLERHRAEIRALFGFREPTNADSEALMAWLRLQMSDSLHDHEGLAQLLAARCQELAIEQPSMERIDRIVRSAVAAQDERRAILPRLDSAIAAGGDSTGLLQDIRVLARKHADSLRLALKAPDGGGPVDCPEAKD